MDTHSFVQWLFHQAQFWVKTVIEDGEPMDPTLGISLTPGGTQPLYQQIFDQIVGRIHNGALPTGSRLPPTRTLAQSLGTTRNTVVRAFDDLKAAGWLESTVGRGTFVLASARPDPSPVSETSTRPWSGLFSRAATSEVLVRAERMGAGVRRRECVDLQGMQPSADLLPDDAFRRCMDHVLRTRRTKAMSYAPTQGVQPLREQLCADLARRGVACRPDDIVVTSGSQHAIDLVTRTLVDPGDTVLVDPQTYAGALRIFGVAGATVVPVPTDADGPAIDALDRHRHAKLLYLMPDGQNPTGTWISRKRRAELVSWSRRSGVPLLEDDYAADIDLDGLPMPPALRALDGDVLHVTTMSKKLIPGLRMGLVVCPPPLQKRLLAIKQATHLCDSPMVQYALAEFLERGYLRGHLARVLPEYRRRRDALVDGLSEHLPDGLSPIVARRGMTVWVSLPDGVDPVNVYAEGLRHGVRVTPGTLNTVTGTEPSGFRMTFCGESPDRLRLGAQRIGAALAAVLSQTPHTHNDLEGP